jgi:transposase
MGRQGSPLPPEIKRVVVDLKHYFDRSKNDEKEFEQPSVIKVAHALNMGVATVKRIMADFNRNPDFSQPILARGRPRRVISEQCQTIARNYIRNANAEGSHITLEMLHEHLKQTLGDDQEYSIRTLGRALDRWGFTFGKGARTAHLKEKDYVVAARRRYLRAKLANRKGDGVIRPEVYLDESYVNKNHSNDYIWYSEEDGPWVQKPTGKGERLIIINAMTKDGWVPNAKLIFKSTKRTGDYHGQMNYELFSKWFENELLKNIPESSLIIMDNAAYHNALAKNSAPTASCKKEVIREWLENNNIPLSDDCLKAEMIEVLNKIAPTPIYAIDEIAKKYGHQILRTPPYHPELQPIETCWAVVKNAIARACDFTMANLIVQLDKSFEKVTAQTCSGLIKKIRTIEDSFWEDDWRLYGQE